MNFHIDIQLAVEEVMPVNDDELCNWAIKVLTSHCKSAELTIRIVDSTEMTNLNHLYRKKNAPTNVLAFPATIPEGIELDYPLLGDVIICPEVLKQESIDLKTPLTAHWAHIVIHGVLHLLGYDHIEEDDALVMQSIEIKLLNEFGYNNPYTERG